MAKKKKKRSPKKPSGTGQLFYKALLEALGAVKKHPFLFVLALLADLIFIFGSSKITVQMYDLLAPHLIVVLDTLTQAMEGATEALMGSVQIDSALDNPAFVESYTLLMKYVSLLIAAIFAMWTVFAGQSWLLCHRMAGMKMTLKTYMGFILKYALVSFLGVASFLGISLLTIEVSSMSMDSVLSLLTSDLSSWLFVVLIVFLVLVLGMLYSCMDKKNPFKAAWKVFCKRPWSMMTAVTVACASVILVNYLFMQLFTLLDLSSMLSLFVGMGFIVAICIPVYVLAKLWLIKVTKKE